MIVGSIQFVLLTGLAIILYHGGKGDAEVHFDFWFWPLSLLGSVTNANGELVGVSTIIFDSSLAFLGVTFAVYWMYARDWRIKSKKARTYVQLLGVVSSAGLIVTGLAPQDILPVMHGIAVWTGLMAFTAVMTVRLYYMPSLGTGALESVLLLYDVLLGLSNIVPDILPIAALVQKFVIGGMLAWYLIRSVDLHGSGRQQFKRIF